VEAWLGYYVANSKADTTTYSQAQFSGLSVVNERVEPLFVWLGQDPCLAAVLHLRRTALDSSCHQSSFLREPSQSPTWGDLFKPTEQAELLVTDHSIRFQTQSVHTFRYHRPLRSHKDQYRTRAGPGTRGEQRLLWVHRKIILAIRTSRPLILLAQPRVLEELLESGALGDEHSQHPLDDCLSRSRGANPSQQGHFTSRST
jgi:hypothetical protein